MVLNWIFLALAGIATAGAAIRWQSTSQADPEYPPRQQTFYFCVTLFLSAAVLLIQTRFPLNSPLFYGCYVVLLPLIGFALTILYRLYRAYRQISY